MEIQQATKTIDQLRGADEITCNAFPVNCDFARRMIEQKFPHIPKLLGSCGLTSSGHGRILDPYSGILVFDDFSNIYAHNMAVGFCAKRICALLEDAGAISALDSSKIEERAAIHDATKPYEILRRGHGRVIQRALNIVQTETHKDSSLESIVTAAYIDLLNKCAHDELIAFYKKLIAYNLVFTGIVDSESAPILEQAFDAACRAVGREIESARLSAIELCKLNSNTFEQRLLRSIIDPGSPLAHETLYENLVQYHSDQESKYLSEIGYETGGPSYRSFLHIDEQGNLQGIKGSLGDMVVHLADDMTATTVASEGKQSRTYFLTTAERLVASGLLERQREVLLGSGLGVNHACEIVEIDLRKPLDLDIRPLGSWAVLMLYISANICERIKTACKVSSSENAELWLKRLIQ